MIIDEFISIYPREAGFLPADFYAGSDFFSILKILPEKEADSVCPKDPALLTSMGYLRPINLDYQCDQYYLRQELTISCWQNGWMKD